MNTRDAMRRLFPTTPGLASLVALAGLAVGGPAVAQNSDDDVWGNSEEYEYEPGEGLHEEEWYDPSDWFNHDNVTDYEYDNGWDWDYGYDDGYGYDDDYGYDYDTYYDDDYGYDYDPYSYDGYWYDTYPDYHVYYYDTLNNDSSRASSRNSQRQGDNAGSGTAELRGRLDGWKRVNLQGQRDSHTIVRLRLENGRSSIVDLGPNVSLSRLNLDTGDQVSVYGRRGGIDGKQVLMARKVRVGDKTVTMNNWDQGRTSRRADRSNSRMDPNRARNQGSSSSRYGSRTGMHPDAQRVRDIIDRWPEASRKAAQSMLGEYGRPDGVTPGLMIWRNTGPFVKSVVYANPVTHNFPVVHKDVLEQFVNFKVPENKVGELAKFDGSIIIHQTDGLMSARCHKEAMNKASLNLAAKVARGDLSASEAREKLASTARAYMDGDRPDITQRLTFDTESSNTDRSNDADQRYRVSSASSQ